MVRILARPVSVAPRAALRARQRSTARLSSLRALGQRLERREPRGHARHRRCVRDGAAARCRPARPDRAHLLDVAGRGPEAEAVEHMDDGLVVGLGRNRRLGRLAAAGRSNSRGSPTIRRADAAIRAMTHMAFQTAVRSRAEAEGLDQAARRLNDLSLTLLATGSTRAMLGPLGGGVGGGIRGEQGLVLRRDRIGFPSAARLVERRGRQEKPLGIVGVLGEIGLEQLSAPPRACPPSTSAAASRTCTSSSAGQMPCASVRMSNRLRRSRAAAATRRRAACR